MTATCRCGRSWSGSRAEHCPACHETFTGTSAGDRHRVGDHSPDRVGSYRRPRELREDGRWVSAPVDPPSPRRCLTVAEMRAAGLELDDRGMWFVVADRERLAQAMRSRSAVPG